MWPCCGATSNSIKNFGHWIVLRSVSSCYHLPKKDLFLHCKIGIKVYKIIEDVVNTLIVLYQSHRPSQLCNFDEKQNVVYILNAWSHLIETYIFFFFFLFMFQGLFLATLICALGLPFQFMQITLDQNKNTRTQNFVHLNV